ncbi:MAG: hypothetical protein JNL50_05565, partial [Phycisphaerae bacterium]|nr:hypothetical protein [Phycisphaerae bacterium]
MPRRYSRLVPVAFGLVWFGFTAPLAAQQASRPAAEPGPGVLVAPDPSKVEWLRLHSSPISMALGAVPDDFKDLEPLRAAIGDSTMVLLGELTHGDAEAFALKARLVTFLHQRMSFDVLVWESGLFDCEEMDRALASESPIADVARMGVFGHWSTGVESFPVFEYARSTRDSARPLRMAGFDIQNSGTAGWTMYPTFAEWLSDPLVITKEVKASLDSLFADARKMSQAADPAGEQRRIELALRALSPVLADAHRSRRAEVVAAI